MEDMILLLDDLSDIVLEDDQGSDLVLEDAEPYQPGYEQYSGSTEFTPTRQAQIILTARKLVLENITINPIPSNYGLVTYSGNIITIS